MFQLSLNIPQYEASRLTASLFVLMIRGETVLLELQPGSVAYLILSASSARISSEISQTNFVIWDGVLQRSYVQGDTKQNGALQNGTICV